MIAYMKHCQKMYNEIERQIDDLTPVSRSDEEENWYDFCKGVIGLSDSDANKCLWDNTFDSDKDIDWQRVYDELDMLHGDTASIQASIDDEMNKETL